MLSLVPQDLAQLHPADLRPLGYSSSKARSIIGIARASVEGKLDLDGLERLNDQECFERLVAMYGVGRWTAEYVLLRGLGRRMCFPAMMLAPATTWSAGCGYGASSITAVCSTFFASGEITAV